MQLKGSGLQVINNLNLEVIERKFNMYLGEQAFIHRKATYLKLDTNTHVTSMDSHMQILRRSHVLKCKFQIVLIVVEGEDS